MTSIYIDTQGLSRIGTCFRPLQDNLRQWTIGVRSLKGSIDPRMAFRRCLDIGTQSEDWMRRLRARCDEEYPRRLCGPWANGFLGRTQQRQATLTGYMDRCRLIYDNWCRTPQRIVDIWDDPEWNYTCTQIDGCIRDIDWDYTDCRNKYTQVCGLTDPGYPRRFIDPVQTYVCRYPATSVSVSRSYTCAYPRWYNDPVSVRWLGGAICNRKYGPAPQPFDYACGYRAAGERRWSTVNGLDPNEGGFYAL
jgi:hypothetical protein